jgi:predicted nucleic acid-binding protein
MTDGPLVIDASVVVEYLTDAGLAEPARSVFESAVAGDAELWAPELILVEAVSALRKMVLRRGITAAQGRVAALRVPQLPVFTTAMRDMIPRLWQLRDRMTPYDATYSALAIRLEAPLVSSDTRLVKAHRSARGKAVLLAEFR